MFSSPEQTEEKFDVWIENSHPTFNDKLDEHQQAESLHRTTVKKSIEKSRDWRHPKTKLGPLLSIKQKGENVRIA